MKKGAIVQVYGRIGVDAYTSTDGQPKASLTLGFIFKGPLAEVLGLIVYLLKYYFEF